MQSFQQGVLVEEGLSGEVGDGAGHTEDAVVGAGGKAPRVVGGAEELLGTGGHPADAAHLPGGAFTLSGRNHFTSLPELEKAEGEITALLPILFAGK